MHRTSILWRAPNKSLHRPANRAGFWGGFRVCCISVQVCSHCETRRRL